MKCKDGVTQIRIILPVTACKSNRVLLAWKGVWFDNIHCAMF